MNENLPETPSEGRGGRKWGCVVAGVLIVGMGLLLWREVETAREAGRRSQCCGHLKMIAIAMLNYHDAYGCFPPAYVADKNGRPMHS
jgi:hypothetical protein